MVGIRHNSTSAYYVLRKKINHNCHVIEKENYDNCWKIGQRDSTKFTSKSVLSVELLPPSIMSSYYDMH